MEGPSIEDVFVIQEYKLGVRLYVCKPVKESNKAKNMETGTISAPLLTYAAPSTIAKILKYLRKSRRKLELLATMKADINE